MALEFTFARAFAATAVIFCASTVAPAQAVTRSEVAHILNRISFGPTPDLLASITTRAQLYGHIREQLHLIGNVQRGPVADALLMALPADPNCDDPLPTPWNRTMLQWRSMILAMKSEDQLREVMTLFWENHFSTNVARASRIGNTNANECNRIRNEFLENEGFRARAFGTFLDLLRFSVSSPAMRYYLNVAYSCRNPLGRIPNEDLARELLELHTLSPNNVAGAANYTTQGDIQEVAEVLAGLYVERPAGTNNDTAYAEVLCNDFAARTLFTTIPHVRDVTIPAMSASAANLDARVDILLSALVQQTETQRFVCSKLMDYFIGDGAAATHTQTLRDCIAAWGQDGDITAILLTIFASPEFNDPMNRSTRIKMPIEQVASQARLFDADFGNPTTPSELEDLFDTTDKLMSASGATLHQFPSPDGYPYASQRQVGAAVFWKIGDYAFRLYSDRVQSTVTNLDFNPTVQIQDEVARLGAAGGMNNEVNVALAGLSLCFHGRHTIDDARGALAYLQHDSQTGQPSAWAWSSTSTEMDDRIRLMCAYLATLPQATEK